MGWTSVAVVVVVVGVPVQLVVGRQLVVVVRVGAIRNGEGVRAFVPREQLVSTLDTPNGIPQLEDIRVVVVVRLWVPILVDILVVSVVVLKEVVVVVIFVLVLGLLVAITFHQFSLELTNNTPEGKETIRALVLAQIMGKFAVSQLD